MKINETGTEIERKFLIKLPDEDFLKSRDGLSVKHITQTYLTIGKKTERRVRKVVEINDSGSETSYIYTEKEHITRLTRIENERILTKEEYESLLDGAYSELTKVRYSFPFGISSGSSTADSVRIIEIDVYSEEIGGDALRGCAVLEVEIAAEDEEIRLPEEIEVIRELTGNRELSNKALARRIQKQG